MNISELKSKLEKTIEYLQGELSKVRTGRASPSMLEEVKVNAYGSKMSIKELGSISVVDAQNMIIAPWDKTLIDSIVKSIREGELNLNPFKDGDIVRVPVPDLTEERRKELAKVVATKVEEVRNSIRSIRQDVMKDIDVAFTNKEISEDEKFSKKEDVEELVKSYTEKATSAGESKKNELLHI